MLNASHHDHPAYAASDADKPLVACETTSWAEPYPGYLDQDVSRFFYRWGGHLSATLIRVRGRFDGDLDQYLLYLVFMLSELSDSLSTTSSAPRTFVRRRGLNALSLSDITQIPRETARRKLLALAKQGYLVRDGDGLFMLGDRYGLDQFFADLRPLFWDAVHPPEGR